MNACQCGVHFSSCWKSILQTWVFVNESCQRLGKGGWGCTEQICLWLNNALCNVLQEYTGWKWLVRRPSNKVSPSRLARTSFLGPAMFNRIGQRLPCRSSFGNWLWWLRTVCNPSEVPSLTLLEMRYKEMNTPWLLYWRVWTEEADLPSLQHILTLEEVNGWNGSTTSSTWPIWLSKGSAQSGLLKIGPQRQSWRIGKSERYIQ